MDDLAKAMELFRQHAGGTDQSVQVLEDNTAKLVAALDRLTRLEVMVGVPADSPERVATDVVTHERISNAALAYIHDNGSPAANIPARPFLRPGVNGSVSSWGPKLAAAASAALEGNESGTMVGLHAAGLIASTAVKKKIRSNIPPPLKPATIARRRRRSAGSKYRRKATTAAQVTALIDTGQLLNSISYAVVERK